MRRIVPKLKALAEDVQYCASRLTKIRDDPEAGFSDGDKAVMNACSKSYEQAKRHLEGHDPECRFAAGAGRLSHPPHVHR